MNISEAENIVRNAIGHNLIGVHHYREGTYYILQISKLNRHLRVETVDDTLTARQLIKYAERLLETDANYKRTNQRRK